MYADEAIKAMLYIRFRLHLSLRELEGFFISLMEICRKAEKVPCYTQVCRRMKSLSLPQKLLSKKGVTDIMLDTIGLKVYGAGEWRAKKYGGKARWIKIHLPIDPKTGKLVLAEVTEKTRQNTAYLEKALKEANSRRGRVLIDRIRDSQRCYELARKYNKELITQPKQGAVTRPEEWMQKRNEAVRVIRGLGGDKLARMIWGDMGKARWIQSKSGDRKQYSEVEKGIWRKHEKPKRREDHERSENQGDHDERNDRAKKAV